MDVIRAQQKAKREEEVRIKKEQEDKYRRQQEKLKLAITATGKEGGEVEEEEILVVEEYLVYICQCCDKKFHTTNQFKSYRQ